MDYYKKYNGSMKGIILLSLFTLVVFSIIIFLFSPKNAEEDILSVDMIQIKGIEYGFIYYNGELYYKNPNIVIYDTDRVSIPIGTNQHHLKVKDVIDNKIKNFGDEICIYAEPEGTEIYSYDGRDDILLIKSDYAVNSYYIYKKGVLPSEESQKCELSYYVGKDNKMLLVSYGMGIACDDLCASDFQKGNNTISFPSDKISDGAMQYYLLVEDKGIYWSFKGEGNVLSDFIIIYSQEGDEYTQYYCKKEGLHEHLIDMYGEFFEIKMEDINVDK